MVTHIRRLVGFETRIGLGACSGAAGRAPAELKQIEATSWAGPPVCWVAGGTYQPVRQSHTAISLDKTKAREPEG